MWNRISGKSSDPKDNAPSQNFRRKDSGDEQRSERHRSGSIVSPNSNKKPSSRGDDRDRGFNPTSTSYSSTSQSPYPGTASASVASSYATASGKNNDDPYVPPGLVRNASLADQMPKLKFSRGERDEGDDGDTKSERRRRDRKDDQKREKRDRRDNKDKDRTKDRGSSRSVNGFSDDIKTSRGPLDFPNEVGGAGFSQFPGQYASAVPGPIPGPLTGTTGTSAEHPAMSSHVQDQFPGQFPTQSTLPYRPPLAVSEGGPGLAAEYYGDAGESVAEQPGLRKHSPSLIIGAEPHLMAASVEANPPPEPSASGGVGAAASFFSGSFDSSEAESSHGQHASSTYATAPGRSHISHHPSSAPAIPTIGGAAMGAAAGYLMSSQTSSHPQRPDQASSVGGPQNGYSASMHQPQTSQTQHSYYAEAWQPPKPSKPSSQASSLPMYAAGAAGATGLTAAAFNQSQNSSSQHGSSMQSHLTTPMAQRHRHRGPLSAIVDFFKDPDGVAQFEEYSEIIGTCRYCFAPGSSPRDAPRRHHYSRRRSNEKLGSTMRVDKDNRYYSSENESRRRKDKPWLATGLAGYGLGKVGETLFAQKNDFDDTDSVKSGRHSPDGQSQISRRRSHSKQHVEMGITSDGKISKKASHGNILGGPSTTTYGTRLHSRSRSRSRSRDRKSHSLTEAAFGAAVGATVAASTSQRRSHSPRGAWVRTRRRSQEDSPERRRKSHKKKREKGFFSFFTASSSSSSLDLAHTTSKEKRASSKNSKGKSKDDKKAEAAFLGLGAAAAALAVNKGRQGHKRKGVKEVVAVKEIKDKDDHGSKHDRRARVSSASEEDDAWESAPEDDQESFNSDLAYGAPARRASWETRASGTSGTEKWGWRWGSEKKGRESPPERKSPDHGNFPAVAGAAAAGLASAAIMSPDHNTGNPMDSSSSLPLQHVYPVPTSDPSRFDVGREGSVTSSTRPGIIPIQHPQPKSFVSPAIYSSHAPLDHSYSAPMGPPVFSQHSSQPRSPTAGDVRSSVPDFAMPGGFSQSEPQVRDTTGDFKLRRRDTSPARFGTDSAASDMTPRRRASTKDDIAAVRFNITEEQEERDRAERRRKRKEKKERREADELEQIDRDPRGLREQSSKGAGIKTSREESPERFSGRSWATPAVAGAVGAAISAAVAEGSKSKAEETKEERRERRRREREREEAEEEEVADKRRERRRRERERIADGSTSKKSGKRADDVQDIDRQGRPIEEETSVWQETARPHRTTTHEDYGAFFAPLELRNRSTDQAKISSANTDADIDLDKTPRIVTVAPEGGRDRSASPVFSPADTNDNIDLTQMSLPWQVPRLRLLQPTPPSSRASTPNLPPKDSSDEEIQEPLRKSKVTWEDDQTREEVEVSPRKPSKITWGDEQTHEYTVITPHYEREDIMDSSANEANRQYQANSVGHHDDGVSTLDRSEESNGTSSSDPPKLYSDDIAFAAALAASAEDAGFDPSIVIDDSKYRRRDSPPGSNERTMPGGFDEEDEPRSSKRERKRRYKSSGGDDYAVVQEIISQVEESDPQVTKRDNVDNEDDWESRSMAKSKKSEKIRQDLEAKEETFETSESTDRYKDSPEDARTTVSSVAGTNDGGSKKSRRKLKRDSNGLDDVVSAKSASSGPTPGGKRNDSLWNRVLGKSSDRSSAESGANDVRSKATAEDFNETKRTSKESGERRSTRDKTDDYGKSGTASGRSRRRRSSEGSTSGIAQDPGRATQELPTKDQELSRSGKKPGAGSVAQYLEHDSEPEKVDEQEPESFLGMRPEPPPPPDIPDKERKPPDPALTADPATPPSLLSGQAEPYATTQTPEAVQLPSPLPSPTAVPLHFRRPQSSVLPRSLCQTPLSPTQKGTDPSPRTKPRPRSIEFTGKDMRPLWLVERHNSHQEPGPEEAYPSLPSSHTTSRASSVPDPEEHGDHQKDEVGTGEESLKTLGERQELVIDSGDKSLQSDLLDSQQATPTAASFQDPTAGHDLPSPHAIVELSARPHMEENRQQPSSTLREVALGAVIGGSAAYALDKASQHYDSSSQNLSPEEKEHFQQGLDEMGPVSGVQRSYEHDSLPSQELFGNDQAQPRDGLDLNAQGSDVARHFVDDSFRDDSFTPQKTTNGKKSQRKANEAEKTVEDSSTSLIDLAPNSRTIVSEPLSPEEKRQKQEQDAQNDVEAWSAPTPSEDGNKKKDLAKEQPEASEPTETGEVSRNDIESGESVEAQGNEGLTQAMSPDQVVEMMASAAQDERAKNQDEISDVATTADQGPTVHLLERRQSMSTVRESLVLDDDLQSSAGEVCFVDPFTDQPSKSGSQPFQPEKSSTTIYENTTAERYRTTSEDHDISPERTPLPIDDDLDLLDELSPSLVIPPADQSPKNGLEAHVKEPLKVERNQGEYPFQQRPLEESRDLPSQVEQSDACDVFAIPTKDKEEEAVPVDPEASADILDEAQVPASLSDALRAQAKQTQPMVGKPSGEESQNTQLPTPVFSADKDPAEQIQPVGDECLVEEPQEAQVPTSVSDADRSLAAQLQPVADEPPVGGSQAEPQAAEEEWAGAGIKEKGKNARRSSTADNIRGERSSLLVNTAKAAEEEQVENFISEPAANVPQEEFPTVEDQWAGSSGKRKSKKQRSKTVDLGLGLFEPEQAEPAHDVQGSIAPSVPIATTTTSEDVMALLEYERVEASRNLDFSEPLMPTGEADQKLQEPADVRSPSTEALGVPTEKMIREEAKQHRIHESKEKSSATQPGETLPTLGSSAAVIDTAKGVQDILEAEDFSLSDIAREGEAEITSAKVEEPSIDTSKEPDEPDWFAAKKKKGKKAKKNEVFSLNEPNNTESPQSITPTGGALTPLCQEPTREALDGLYSKKSKKDKKNKKNSLSRTAGDYQGTVKEDPRDIEDKETSFTKESLSLSSGVGIAVAVVAEADNDASPQREGPEDVSKSDFAQEQDFVAPKSKKNKKKSKKSKPFVFEDERPPASEDEPASASRDVEGNISGRIKPADVAAMANTPSTGLEDLEDVSKSEFKQGQDFATPKSKKEKKKSEKPKPPTLEAGRVPAFEDEPGSASRNVDEDVPERTMPPGDIALADAKKIVESRPKSNKDKKKAKKSQAFVLEDEGGQPDLGQGMIRAPDQKTNETATDKTKVDEPISAGDFVTSQQESREQMPEPFESTSKGDPSEVARADASLIQSIEDNGTKAPEEFEVRQFKNPELPVDTAVNLDKFKEDEKKDKKARASTWDGDIQSEPKELSGVSSASNENPNAPLVTPIPRHSEDWSKQERFTEGVETNEVVEPNDKPTEARDVEESTAEARLSEEMRNLKALDEVDPEEEFALVKKGRMGKKSKKQKLPAFDGPEKDQPVVEADTFALPSRAVSMDESGPLSKNDSANELRSFEEPQTIQKSSSHPSGPAMEPESLSTIVEAADVSDPTVEDERRDVPVKKDSEGKNHDNEKQRALDETESDESVPPTVIEAARDPTEATSDAPISVDNAVSGPAIKESSFPSADIEASGIPVQGSSIPAAASELLDHQEQRPYAGEHAENVERQYSQRPQSPRDGLPSPGTEVEMLYAQDQGEYDNAHRDELERRHDIEDAQSPAKPLQSPVEEVEMLYAQDELEYGNELTNEQDMERPRSTDRDLPKPAAGFGMLDPQDQQRYYEEDAREREQQDIKRPQSPGSDLPTPAKEVELLDPQQQRQYNEEYAKELERLLSPQQDVEQLHPPPSEAHTPLASQPSISAMMQKPYADVHRPLAQAPGLEDIIEESRSRPGSIQESPAPPDRDDDFSPFKPSKKSSKGRKAKNQQPTIWEDETATPPVDEETEQLAQPADRSTVVPGSWESGEISRPIDLEEPIEQRPMEERDYISPTRDLSSYRESPREHGEPGDYFGIQPSRGAEEDVGIEETEEYQRAMSTELPPSSREESVGQEPYLEESDGRDLARHGHHHNQGETAELEAAEWENKSRTESTSGDERASGDLELAHSRKSNKGGRSKRSLGFLREDSEGEPNFPTQQSDETVDQSSNLATSTTGSVKEVPATEELSRQRASHYEAKPIAKSEDHPSGKGRSKSTEGLAVAAGLGIGALAVEDLLKRDSEKEKNGSKKNKKASSGDNFEGDFQESEYLSNEGQSIDENRERRPMTESLRSQQHFLDTPPPSPPPSTRYEPVTSQPDNRNEFQTLQSSSVRDSAIQLAVSPIVSEEMPLHRAVRDSGYPETEASPIVSIDPQYRDEESTRELEDLDGREPEHGTYLNDHGYQRKELEESRSESPSNAAVEVDPIGDAPISTSKDRRRRARRRRSGATYDSDDSNDSGFDIQRRRRKRAMKNEARDPSPVSSTTKERSSELFGSSPSARQEHANQPGEYHTPSSNDNIREEPTWSFGQEGLNRTRSREESVSPFNHEGSPQRRSRDGLGETSDKLTDLSGYENLTEGHNEPSASLFGAPIIHEKDPMHRSMSPPRSDVRGRPRLNTISEETSPLRKKDKRATLDVGSPEAGVKERRMRSQSPPADNGTESYIATNDFISRQTVPTNEYKESTDIERSRSRNTDQSSRHSNVSVPHKHYWDGEERKSSVASIQSDNSIHAIIRTPDQVRSASGQSFRSSATPPLRRVDRSASGDLRSASKASEVQAKSRAKYPEEDPELDINIPSSSTYDPLTDKGKARADMADVFEGYGDARGGSPMSPTRPPSMRKRQSMQLLEYQNRLDQLVSENRLLQSQKTTVERSLEDQARDHSQQRHAYEEAMQQHKMFLAQKDKEVDELKGTLGEWRDKVTHLTEVNDGLTSSRTLGGEYEERYHQLEEEHTNLREQHTQLSAGMEDIVRHEVSVALEEKDVELRQLRDELENAKQQVRKLQQQLLASKFSDEFVERDEDYFDGQCQLLCQHVQQWVLRFSKFSDMKLCYRASEVRDDKVVDRMENAILDGTDVDDYLQDRVRRRDVFMSVVMTMIWEFIFTRYLFGMDREQRQKLKNLERTLQEVGPISAVHKWRATTLTLLMKREAFETQRRTDTEAVVHEIYDTLATFLPPPSSLVNQIQESLRKVISAAVDLSIEMRTQRAEYSMLPPLQPEYDTNGDLARKVYFSALTMNERSGQTSSNEELQEQRAVVRMVLFPLVVKNEDDDEQIVVCPAQVLVAEGSKGKGKSVRVTSAQGARSEASFAGTDVNMEGGGGMI